MPINGTYKVFTETNVNNAPNSKGVYALYRAGSKETYIGMSESSVRSRLQDHHSGREGNCTQKSDKFKVELTSYPRTRERELLEEFKRKYGTSPLCND